MEKIAARGILTAALLSPARGLLDRFSLGPRYGKQPVASSAAPLSENPESLSDTPV
jgi:hypothetical protein